MEQVARYAIMDSISNLMVLVLNVHNIVLVVSLTLSKVCLNVIYARQTHLALMISYHLFANNQFVEILLQLH